MKRIITCLLFSMAIVGTSFSQTRYVDEVFTNVDVDSNILYSTNFSVLAGTPIPTGSGPIPALEMEVYSPSGDTETNRPLIIHMHTGTFLPIIHNGNPTGSRFDAATSLMCQGYAKRGYVVANIEYRLGWNPMDSTQALRAASLMKAVYRGIQDAKAAVRYFRKDYATNNNSYGIDTSKIILSGQGSGGWIALGYATVDKLSEIQLPKFLDLTDPNNPVALLDTSVIGDWDGFGGNPALNMDNYPGYSDDIHCVLSMGGGIGDLSWLEAGDVPMVAVHCPTDPVATYTTGDVSVQQIGIVTTDISGGYDVLTKANALGNNDIFNNAGFNDPYTLGAQAASLVAQGMVDIGGTTVGAPVDNLFPYVTGNPYESSPWDYWDSTVTVDIIAPAVGLTSAEGIAAHQNGITTNPDMNVMKAMAFIDSTLGFFCRRAALATGLITADVNNLDLNNSISMFPVPASNMLTITSNDQQINGVEIFTVTGKLALSKSNVNSNVIELTELNLPAGIYVVNTNTNNGMISKKLIIQ